MGISHQPCPDCGSSDAMQINDDGSTYCHSCRTYHPPVDSPKEEIPSNFLKGRALAIPERKIESKTCQKYKYMTGEYKGKEVHIATYRDLEGTPVFQKIRIVSEKKFFTIGTFKPLLYGAHLFKGRNKKIIITEGEIDALSTWQVIGDYPVVSVPNGAQAAKEAIKYNLEFLEKFEEVLFMFDSDKYGTEAAKECASLISIGKAKIITLPLKDANEMLKSDRTKELYRATWEGAEYRPDGIISGEELWDEITKPIEEGLSYPFPMLTYLTYGIRIPEFICFGAGTGIGKTDLFKEIETHLLVEHKQKIGIIHLEESKKDTVLGLMTKHSGIKFHLPDTKYTQEEKRKAFDETAGTGRVFIYDNFGTTDLATIENNIRYMVKGKGCKFIFLDHITALGDAVENSADVNQKMRNIVSGLTRLTRELNFTLFGISHLRKSSDTKPHEEGGRIHLDDLYGAKAISQWASFVFGLERNQQADDVETRHTTILRCLKDRYTGQATGCTTALKFDEKTGKLYEVDNPPKDIVKEYEFSEEKGDY